MNVLIYLFLFALQASAQCGYYMAPSLLPGAGVGIYAGVDISMTRGIFQAHSIIVDKMSIRELGVESYDFASHFANYGCIFFGASTIINHLDESKSNAALQFKFSNFVGPEYSGIRPYSTYPQVQFQASSNIKAGQEITHTYGDAEYFEERGITYIDTFTISSYNLDELMKVGRCMTDKAVAPSVIPMGGEGFFSRRTFRKGTIVGVSPVLVVPKHVLFKTGRSSTLLNYCISVTGTDVALLPIGNEAMINHGSKREANVELRWFDWEGRPLSEVLDALDVNRDLFGAKSAPLYLGYYATRDIVAGEELLLWYGAEWEEAWRQYLDHMHVWLSVHGEGGDLLSAPLFRHPVGAPDGLFPARWLTLTCIGHRCESRGPSIMSLQWNATREFSDNFNDRVRNLRVTLEDVNKSKQSFVEVGALSAGKVEVELVGVDGNSELVKSSSHRRKTSSCGLYYAPLRLLTTPDNQRWRTIQSGVFAGSKFKSRGLLAVSSSIYLEQNLLKYLSLKVNSKPSPYAHYHSLLIGHGALVRFSSTRINAQSMFNADDLLAEVLHPQGQYLRPYSVGTDIVHMSNKEISPAEEVKIPAPDNTEDTSRASSATIVSTRPYHVEELVKKGHCLSDLHIASSAIPLVGSGVFTRTEWPKGALTSISPVYILPKHAAAESPGLLINYLIAHRHSDVALLPIGVAGMINHGSKREANVELRWFDWEGRPMSEVLPKDLDINSELIDKRDVHLYLGYYATRDIAAGEELLLWYGAEWEEAWRQYLDHMHVWLSVHGEGGDLLSAPLFRHPVGAPDGLFPEQFMGKACMGQVDCVGYASRRRPSSVARELNEKNSTTLSVEQIVLARARLAETPERKYFDRLLSYMNQITSKLQERLRQLKLMA